MKKLCWTVSVLFMAIFTVGCHPNAAIVGPAVAQVEQPVMTTAISAASVTQIDPAKNALDEAFLVLNGLESATGAAITYRDFAPRVIDAKIQVDRFLNESPDGPAKTSLAEAMQFYVYASMAWNASISSSNYEAVALNPLYRECDPLQQVVKQWTKAARLPSTIQARGIVIAGQGIPAILACGGAQIRAAEEAKQGGGTKIATSLAKAGP